MLAITHLVTGAAVGLAVDRPLPRTLAALASHALLDGVGHDDAALSVYTQGVLAGAAVVALAASWGLRSPVMSGAVTATLPDAEVAINQLVFEGRLPGYLFPSHWVVHAGQKGHPYRYPIPGLSIGVELATSVAGLVVLCALGVRRRRERRVIGTQPD